MLIKKEFEKNKKITYKVKFVDTSTKDELLIFNCLKCSKSHKKHFNNYLQRFANTYKFSAGDINKFCLMLRKGAYLNKYMDS